MTLPRHRQRSLKTVELLTRVGFPPEVQQRMGVLGIVWGLFETHLELAVWALREEKVQGVRPSTDHSSVSKRIEVLGEGTDKFGENAQGLLKSASLAATDLMEYRHALAHGWLLALPGGSSFLRNPSLAGELRKRPSHDAHVDENLLDMAIDAAWVLFEVARSTSDICKDSSKLVQLLALKADVSRARSSASELRHLTALMNREDY